MYGKTEMNPYQSPRANSQEPTARNSVEEIARDLATLFVGFVIVMTIIVSVCIFC